MDIIAGGFGLVVNSAFQGISQDPDDLIAALLDCDITPCDDSPGDNVVQNGGFADYMSAVANSGNAEILTNVFVQVEEYFDASISVRQAAKLVAAGGRGWSEGKKRLLNLVLTDGVHTLPAIEFTRCPALDRVSPGCKLLLAPRENAPLVVTRGRLLLRADNVQYLGGTVRELAEADAAYWRERMLEVVGKPYVVRQHSSQPQVSGVPQQAPQVAASSHVQRQPQQQQPAQQQQPPQHQPFQQGRASPPPPQQQRPQPFQAPPPQQQPQPFHPQQQPFQQRASPTPQFQQPAQPTNLLELDDDTTPIKRSQSSSPSVSQTPRFAQEVFTYWSDVLEQRGSQRDTPLDVSIRGYFVELAGTLVYQHGHYQLRVIADDGTQLQEVTLTDEFLTKVIGMRAPDLYQLSLDNRAQFNDVANNSVETLLDKGCSFHVMRIQSPNAASPLYCTDITPITPAMSSAIEAKGRAAVTKLAALKNTAALQLVSLLDGIALKRQGLNRTPSHDAL